MRYNCLRQSEMGTNEIVHKLSDKTQQPNNCVVPILNTQKIYGLKGKWLILGRKLVLSSMDGDFNYGCK